jgi:hypothetical protein
VRALYKDFFQAIRVVFFDHQQGLYRCEQGNLNQETKLFIFQAVEFSVDVGFSMFPDAACFATFWLPS